jgi:hypothetical protein
VPDLDAGAGGTPDIDPVTGLPWGVLPPPPPEPEYTLPIPGPNSTYNPYPIEQPTLAAPGTPALPGVTPPPPGDQYQVLPPPPPMPPADLYIPPPNFQQPAAPIDSGPALPPPPPLPQTPTGPVAPSYGGGGQGMSQGGMGPQSPSATSFRPQAPLWARGLSRSPFSQWQQRNAQSSLFAQPFQPEVLPEDLDEQRRQQMMGEVPPWAMPTV